MRSDDVSSAAGMLARFVTLVGAKTRLPAIAGALDDAPPTEEIADRFTSAGVPARALRIDAIDLPFVPVPALVRTRSGGHGVLRSASRGAATLELSPGKVSILPEREVLALLDGTAVVVASEPSPRGQGAFDHWQSILRASPNALTCLRRLVVLSILLFALGVVTPLVTRLLVDTALPNVQRSTLWIVVAITLVVAFHRAVASWLRERAMLFVDVHVEGEFLRLVFARVIGMPLSSRKTTSTGDLQQTLASAQAYSSGLTKGLLTPLFDAFLSTGYLAALAWLAPGFALAAILSTLVYLGLAIVQSRRLRTLQSAEIAALAAERASLLELIGGLPTLRAAAAEAFALRSWRRSLSTYQCASVRRADAESWTNHTLELVERITRGGVLIGGAWMCLHGRASVGELLGAMGALGAYGAALQSFAKAVLEWATLSGHAERIGPALRASAPSTPTSTSISKVPERPRPPAFHDASDRDAIVIDRLWFRHEKGLPWLLQDYSLRVPRGTITELRWPSGRGKTTLLRILAGLLTPEHGTIAIEHMDATQARDHVLYLPQEAHLFSGSVLENLRLLSGGASMDRIARAAGATGLAEVVSAWPMGFETLVSSRGANVSSGQRQLVLLTAAIASDRPILLLDESLANVDRIQRARILEANLFAGRTVVSVVHDTVKNAPDERPALRVDRSLVDTLQGMPRR